MKDVQCYELYGGVALKDDAFSSTQITCIATLHATIGRRKSDRPMRKAV